MGICSVEDFGWSCPHLRALVKNIFLSFILFTQNVDISISWNLVIFQDLQCWRLCMKLSTSPCSRSIASIMLPRSGQSKQVLIFFTLYSVLFLNSFSNYLKEVWIVSSTCSIASFTCKWNYTYLTKNCHVKKKHGYHGTPTGTWVLSIFCLFRKTSLLFFLSLSAFVQVRRHFSNWPRKYMQRAWRKSNNTFSNRVAEVARSREGPSPKSLHSNENLKP